MNLRFVAAPLFLIVVSGCQPAADESRMVGVLASDRVELTAEFSEPIVARLVVEGQSVTKGAAIIQQSTARADARVREASANLAQNKARLSELIRGPRKEQIIAAQANVDGAVQNLAFRRTELDRSQTLLDRELAPPDVRDRAQAALDAAGATLDFNQARLAELLTGTTVEELDQARASVQRSDAQLEQLKIDLDRLTIAAPDRGVIDSLLFEVGERPAPGQPIAIMLGGAQPYARVYIPEDQRAVVMPGTAARVFVDGIAEAFDGRVRWIASEAAFTPYFALTEHDRGRLTFLAKIDIPVTDRRLPDGVPVEVEIVHRSADTP